MPWSVTSPRQIPTREGLPAVNVKCQTVDWPSAAELATQYDVSEADAQTVLNRLWDIAVSDFWTRAEEIARDVLGSEVKVYAAGRSSGWLIVDGLPSYRDAWNNQLRRKWGRFHRELMDEIEHRRSREWAEHEIEEGEMLPLPPTDAELIRELTAAVRRALNDVPWSDLPPSTNSVVNALSEVLAKAEKRHA